MKIALVGYGKMGRAIAAEAHSLGFEVVSRIDPTDTERTHDAISSCAIAAADVCIEFSHPSVAVENIKAIASLGKPLIIGTTGWYDHIQTVHEFLIEKQIAALYAENFALGMQFFFKIVAAAAHYASLLDDLDLAISEEHHRNKVDAPSGTALALAEILNRELQNTPKITSLRCGSITGSHSVIFDSPHEQITLTHTARSRKALASGALRAVRLLPPNPGLHHLSSIL